ncbi:unnamed protein product [Closterium sp. NIES-53]
MDVWGPARVSGQDRKRYFLLAVDDFTRYTTVFPLRSKGEIPDVLIPWIRVARLKLHERLGQDLPVLRLHSDRGGMEVARTSMIHVAAPHFLWPFTVRYAAHQLNLWPHVSLPETSPTLRWTRKIGDASVFRFYKPTSRSVLLSQDITFDESVPFYRLFPYRSAPLPPPLLFLARDPPPVDPLPPQGPAPSGVSQVDPLPGIVVCSPHTPLEWSCRSWSCRGWWAGGVGGGDPSASGAGAGGTRAVDPGARGTGSAGAGGVWGTGAGGAGAGGTGAGGTSVGGARAGGVGAGEPGAEGARAVDPGVGGAGAGSAMFGGTGVGGTTYSFTERREPESRPASPIRAVRTGRRVPRPRPPSVPGTHAMALCPSFVPLRVPLPPPLKPESDLARVACPTITRLLATFFTDPSFESAAASALVAELVDFAAACRLDCTTSLVADSES